MLESILINFNTAIDEFGIKKFTRVRGRCDIGQMEQYAWILIFLLP
jgi:hypothetical protein